MNERRPIDPKRARAVVGSGAAIAVLLAAGVMVANALAAKPTKHAPTTTTSTTATTVPATGKVTVCHHTHSKTKPSHAITIDVHAWKAHQKHGDTVGACPATTTTTTTTTTAAPVTTTTTTTSSTTTSAATHGNSANAPGHNKNKH
jgi:hypothetical protein